MFRLLRKIKFIFIFVCFILFVGGVAVFGNSHFNKKVNEVPSSTEVNNSTNENNTNILLLGEDTNSMMIASVDEEKKKQLYREQKQSGTIRKGKKIGRNDPCPCGSGKKYKMCCGRNA